MNFYTTSIILLNFLFCTTGYASGGSLILSTIPSNANVYVDGLLRANITPITLKLPAGKHYLEVKQAGKQMENLVVLIKEGEVITERVTLLDLPPSKTSEIAEINILKILNPLRGYLETTPEFAERRQQLLNGFNQRVQRRDPAYQAGIATLDKEHYDPVSGTLPVMIQKSEWTQQFNFLEKGSIAIWPEEAKLLWEEGLTKPVYLYFELAKNETVVSQTVLIGPQKEWVIGEVSGYLSMVSSDELANLMTVWMEKYHTLYPNVHFQMLLENTATVSATFTDGNSRIALLPRKMTDLEKKQFITKYGYSPLEIRVAMEALGIYVQQTNPIKGLTLPQLDAIFSVTKKCGYPEDIKVWGQLEFENHWVKQTITNIVSTLKSYMKSSEDSESAINPPPPTDWKTLGIQLFGRNSATSAYRFFQKQALCGGEFKNDLDQQAEEVEELVKLVSDLPNNVGFSKLMEENLAGVRMVAIKNENASWFSSGWVEPTADNAIAGDYPLTRFVWMYINQSPELPLSAVFQKFLRLVFSDEGQQIAGQQEFTPLSKDFIAAELEKLK